MLFHIILLLVLQLTIATPPACFLDCINNISRICTKNQADVKCLCRIHEAVNQCIVKYCPRDHFFSARDHFGGTCIEHGFQFQSFIFDDDEEDGHFSDFQEENSNLEDEEEEEVGAEAGAESENEISDYEEEEMHQDVLEAVKEPENEPEDAGDWSEGEEWLENNDWPQEKDLDLSEINQDVIKNYVTYFLKKNPPSRPHIASVNGKASPKHKVVGHKIPKKKSFISHGPSSHVSETSKGAKDKSLSHKTQYHKYDVGFDREKQDQILRKRS